MGDNSLFDEPPFDDPRHILGDRAEGHVDYDDLDDVLSGFVGDDGTPLKTLDPEAVLTDLVTQVGGTARRGQIDMAVESAATLSAGRGHALVVSAPTGTGKSLAYLAAAAAAGAGDARADTGRGRTVIVTATKALQGQLESKDLPVLEAATGIEFAKLVGTSNYVCLSKLDGAAADATTKGEQQDLLDNDDTDTGDVVNTAGADIDGYSDLLAWVESDGCSGERDDLPFQPSSELWSKVSVSAGECTSSNCSRALDCFALKARDRAKSAPVVIANAALYAAHLAVVNKTSDLEPSPGLVGHHDRVIIDEAHKLGDAVSSALTVEIAANMMRGALNAYLSVVADGDAARKVATRIEKRFGDALKPHTGTWLQQGLPDDVAEVLGDALAVVGDWRRQVSRTEPINDALSDRKKRATKVLTGRSEAFTRLLEPTTDIVWVDETGALKLTPAKVSTWAADYLWETVSAVLCSATIPTNLEATLGLNPTWTRRMVAESPFDYPSTSILYVPHMPSPKGDRDVHEAACVDQVEKIMRAAGGRTISLHTSRRAMHMMTEELQRRLAGTGIVVLSQDDLPRAELLRMVAEQPEVCLVATQGMWEGISIDGDSVIAVCIDRLPFAPPTDPVGQARKAAAGDRWFDDVLASAGMMLAQGAGRLIRTTNDRGVVAILDPRLGDRNLRYQKTLVNQLPRSGRTRSEVDVLAALEALVEDPTATFRTHQGVVDVIPTPTDTAAVVAA